MTDIENINESIFESIKHINEHGQEYWTARELQPVLEYTKWENFKVAITRAMEACKSSKIKDSDHFAEVRKMVTIGSGAKRELAANLFRATQTEEKLRRDHVKGKENANKTHFGVGKKVRQTIQELGGTMPEDLPTPDKSIQQIERAQKKQLKKD